MEKLFSNELINDILIILAAIILYVLCIGMYFKLKKKKSSKFSSEIIVIALAILLSALFKTIIFIKEFEIQSNDINGIIRSVISAIFSSIGGLQFEGLPLLDVDFSEVSNNLKTAYYVSSLWSGLVFLTIFSFAISVEFANACKLRISLFLQWLFRLKRHIYVFTSVTEDAITLAKSIEKHHLKEREKCLIIFAGDIGAFDKLNPLCSKIFSSGYLYYSINANNDNKTILEILKVSKLNNVSLFAFSLNENMVADDQKNAEVIFSETNRIINKFLSCLKKDETVKEIFKEKIEQDKNQTDPFWKNDKIKLLVDKYIKNTIHLYVLTKNETNIRAFNSGLKDELEGNLLTIFKDYGEVAYSLWRHIATKVQIIPINEADLAAKDFNKKRLDLMIEKGLFNFKNIFGDRYKVLSLGFGEKGQAVMTKLYETSAIVDYNGNILPFYANIFDEKVDNVSGTFLTTHPMFAHIDGDCTDLEKEIKEVVDRKIKSIYGENGVGKIDPNSIPVIKLNNKKCLSNEFFKYIDQCTGITNEACTYDAIIIALGDDTYTLKLANAIIRDIANEYDKFNMKNDIRDVGKVFQFIGVNIRNKNNLKQIESDIARSCLYEVKEDNNKIIIGKSFEVITFGDAEEMYTYENIIGNNEAKEYSYRYSILLDYYRKINNTDNQIKGFDILICDNESNYLRDFCNKFYDGANKTLEEVILSMSQRIMSVSSKKDQSEINEHWHTEDIFSKRSNEAALCFKKIYEPYLSSFLKQKFSDDTTFEMFNFASKFEHERWMRFHIANGFKYNEVHNKTLKKHARIVAFEQLEGKYSINDAVNVAMAFSKTKTKEK